MENTSLSKLMEEELKINVSSRTYENNDCVEEMEKLKIIKEQEEAEKRKIYYREQKPVAP